MERWEYLELYVFGEDWIDNTGRSGKLPNYSSEIWKGYYSLGSLLNKLGIEGWELSTNISGSTANAVQLLFKRKI
jgi:hypothetical protein